MTRKLAAASVWAAACLTLFAAAPALAQVAPYTAHTQVGRDVEVSANSPVDESGNDVAPSAKPITGVITRPANTTTYTVNAAWANATSGATYGVLTGACRNKGGTTWLDIGVVDGANQTTKLSGELWFFNAAPTAINDNAAFSIAAADWPSKAAATAPLVFTASSIANPGSGVSGITTGQATPPTGQFLTATCAGGSNDLDFMVKVTNAYVPVSGEVLTVVAHLVQVN